MLQSQWGPVHACSDGSEGKGDDRNGEDASEMVRWLGRPERVLLGLEDAMVGD